MNRQQIASSKEMNGGVRLATRKDYHAMVGVRARWLDSFLAAHPAEQRWCPATCRVPEIEDEQALLMHLAGKDGRWAAVSQRSGKTVAYILSRTDEAEGQLRIEGQTPRVSSQAEFDGQGGELLSLVLQQAAKQGLKKVRASYHGFPDEVQPLRQLYNAHGFAGECLFEMLTRELSIDAAPKALQFRSAEQIGLEAYYRSEVQCGAVPSIERSQRNCEFSRKMWGNVEPGRDWLAAFDSGELVAAVRVAVSREGVGVLDAIGVAPERRGQGIGRAVLARGLAALIGRTDAARLDVHRNNPAAIRLYQRAGFEVHHVHGQLTKDVTCKDST